MSIFAAPDPKPMPPPPRSTDAEVGAAVDEARQAALSRRGRSRSIIAGALAKRRQPTTDPSVTQKELLGG